MKKIFNEKQIGLGVELDLKEIFSKEDFAIDILELIHKNLNYEKNNFFPCDCSCIQNNLNITLLSNENSNSKVFRNFEYSLKTGFYPFDLVAGWYLEFLPNDYIFILIVVDQDCNK